MYQQVRNLQAHVQSLEQELTRHKERIKDYEHTVERLSMQNSNHSSGRKSSHGLTGRPSMDTRLLKSFLHGSSPSPSKHNHRNDGPDSETDTSSVTTSPSPQKVHQETRPARSSSADEMVHGYATDLRTMTAERDRLFQRLKEQSAAHKREVQRLKLRCSIAESESVTLKAKLEGMEPTELDVLANPTLRQEVDRAFEARDKLEEENGYLRALLTEALAALPADEDVAHKIRELICEHDDSGSEA